MKTLSELLIIAIGSAIVNNVVLSQFLGICPFLGVSKKLRQLQVWRSSCVCYYTFFPVDKFDL